MQKSLEATNRACNEVVSMVDEGSLYSSGRLNIMNSDSTMLTYLPFSVPAFRDATDGTSVANMIYDATSFMDGTAALFDVVNRDASNVWSGTISTFNGVGDMKLNSVIFAQDSTVSISYAYYAIPR